MNETRFTASNDYMVFREPDPWRLIVAPIGSRTRLTINPWEAKALREYFQRQQDDDHPEPKQLPTDPGYYQDRDGHVWVIVGAGGPLLYLTGGVSGLQTITMPGPEEFAPFTRLVPEVAS